jgi:hypothetical protein
VRTATVKKTAAKAKLVKISATGKRAAAKATEFAAVLDTTTGLMAAVNAAPNALTFRDAEALIAELNAKRYAGHNDWRLPTVPELVSFVYYTRYSPAADTEFFPDVQSSYYWTGTPCAFATSCVFAVGFGYGCVDYYRRRGRCFVRPVRVARQ